MSDQRVFEDLEAGTYTVEVVDANGCMDALTFDIEAPQELTATLELNTASNTIQLGDSVQLMPTFSGAFATFEWTPTEAFDVCDLALDSLACLNPWVQPTENTSYTLSIENEMGCTATASIEVLVESDAKVVFPTVFSPNGDGLNDEFGISANGNAQRIQSLAVFSRWGEKVFERLDFDPNDDTVFWDGLYKGKEMEVGVFVYYSVVEFRDGNTGVFQGNLTLVR
ncbi:MAG: gliding motility-associated C-terminal domain-containing protein [Chitinophagales bacterium]